VLFSRIYESRSADFYQVGAAERRRSIFSFLFPFVPTPLAPGGLHRATVQCRPEVNWQAPHFHTFWGLESSSGIPCAPAALQKAQGLNNLMN
jgi:hypothetical protein